MPLCQYECMDNDKPMTKTQARLMKKHQDIAFIAFMREYIAWATEVREKYLNSPVTDELTDEQVEELDEACELLGTLHKNITTQR